MMVKIQLEVYTYMYVHTDRPDAVRLEDGGGPSCFFGGSGAADRPSLALASQPCKFKVRGGEK